MWLSGQLWTMFSLILNESEAVNKFHNCKQLNGAEVWRKLVQPIKSNTPEMRHRLHDRVRGLAKASKLDDVMSKIEQWENNLRTYCDAGGRHPDEEDTIILALSILPTDLPFSFVSGLRKIREYDELRERLREEVDYYANGAHKSGTGRGRRAAEEGGGGSKGKDGDVEVEGMDQ